MPKESLRDHLNGNELDLSMSNLETVPVRELITLPKATHLDLSNNKLTALPDGFCNLSHIIRLDLSKNALQELPKDFGQLENLQHLDLLGNQLKTLPRSFAQLHKLKWLDLKDNPLEMGLKKNAGDCLDDTECRKCAIRILMYMKDLDSQLERQSQMKLKKQKELEAKKLEEEEKEKQRKRQEKRVEKERRRRELEAKRAQERLAQNADTSDEEVTTAKEKHKYSAQKPTKRMKSNGCGAHFTLVLLSFLVLVIALLVAIDFHCNSSQTDQYCVHYWHPSRKQFFTSAKICWTFIVNFYHKHIEKYFFV